MYDEDMKMKVILSLLCFHCHQSNRNILLRGLRAKVYIHDDADERRDCQKDAKPPNNHDHICLIHESTHNINSYTKYKQEKSYS